MSIARWQGADLTPAFPSIAVAGAGLDVVLDGELVVPARRRLDFGELQRRARRRGRSAVEGAAEDPTLTGGVRLCLGHPAARAPSSERLCVRGITRI